MAGLMQPPAIDVTPGPGDVTNFDQVKGQAPARHPTLEPKPNTPAPSNAVTKPSIPSNAKENVKEIQLDHPHDSNRVNQMPESVWKDLEVFGEEDAKPGPVKESDEPVKPSNEQESPDKPDEAPVEKSDLEPPDTFETDVEKKLATMKTFKEVRAAHKEALKRERAWSREKTELAAKLSDYETRIKNGDTEHSKALAVELESAKKRTEELEARVRTLDYTQSSEFHEKYAKPVAKALESAYADLNEMSVLDEDGNRRKATEADFKSLVGLPLEQAHARAKQLFGDLATEVLAHRRVVRQLEIAKREALANAEKSSEESRQRQANEQLQRSKAVQEAFKQRAGELEAKFPQLFKTREGDQEGNELLEKGHGLIRLLEDPSLADEDRVKLATEVKYRAAGYGRLLRDYRKLQAQLAEIEKRARGQERSEPREGNAAPNGVPSEPADPMSKAFKSMESFVTTV